MVYSYYSKNIFRECCRHRLTEMFSNLHFPNSSNLHTFCEKYVGNKHNSNTTLYSTIMGQPYTRIKYFLMIFIWMIFDKNRFFALLVCVFIAIFVDYVL